MRFDPAVIESVARELAPTLPWSAIDLGATAVILVDVADDRDDLLV